MRNWNLISEMYMNGTGMQKNSVNKRMKFLASEYSLSSVSMGVIKDDDVVAVAVVDFLFGEAVDDEIDDFLPVFVVVVEVDLRVVFVPLLTDELLLSLISKASTDLLVSAGAPLGALNEMAASKLLILRKRI